MNAEKVKQFNAIWASVSPHVPVPDSTWWKEWFERYPDGTIEHGIRQAAERFREDIFPRPSPNMVYRYAGRIMQGHTVAGEAA